MKQLLFYIALLLSAANAFGQRVNFKTFAQDELILSTIAENPNGLNFNNKQAFIPVGNTMPIDVNLLDNATVVIEVDAPAEYDLTLSFAYDNALTWEGGSGPTIPYLLRFAYNNTGELSDSQRRGNAVEVPVGFNTVTLPVRRRVSGAPGPPPTPEHSGYIRPRAKAYVYVYGQLGAVPSNANSGTYTGNVVLTISHADLSF